LQPLEDVRVVGEVVDVELGLVDLAQQNLTSLLVVTECLAAKEDVHGQHGTPEAG
jgi:hypothetical protein